jgi:hypothetical protein
MKLSVYGVNAQKDGKVGWPLGCGARAHFGAKVIIVFIERTHSDCADVMIRWRPCCGRHAPGVSL